MAGPRLPVAVDEDGLLAVLAKGRLGPGRPAADQRVLSAIPVAGVIGEGAVRLGHAAIVLADAPAHLGDEPLAQVGRVGQRRVGKAFSARR